MVIVILRWRNFVGSHDARELPLVFHLPKKESGAFNSHSTDKITFTHSVVMAKREL